MVELFAVLWSEAGVRERRETVVRKSVMPGSYILIANIQGNPRLMVWCDT